MNTLFTIATLSATAICGYVIMIYKLVMSKIVCPPPAMPLARQHSRRGTVYLSSILGDSYIWGAMPGICWPGI